MSNGLYRFAGIAGPVAATFAGVGLYLAGWIPPPSPSSASADIAAYYQAHWVAINVCAICMFIMQAGVLTQYIALADQVSKLDAPYSDTWGKVVMGNGIMAIFPPLMAGMCWATAAYRPERSSDVTQALHDLGWFCFVDAGVCVAIIQFWCIGIATLRDKSRLFPRWYSYFNFWNGLVGLCGLTVPFFKIGPFAWNGVASFWVPAILFGIFLNVNYIVMGKFDRRYNGFRAENAGNDYAERDGAHS